MELRKWRTNSDELRRLIPEHLLEKDTSLYDIQPSPSAQKALGVHWDTQADTLHVAVPSINIDTVLTTKRSIAAATAGVFDVLGLFAPVVVVARILFQDTWRLGLGWDEDVPPPLQERWTQWISDLSVIHEMTIPRRLFSASPLSSPDFTLHGFCDASSVAYGAAVYGRLASADNVETSLILAKARVLPTKPITIPKAELASAHLLAKLLDHVLQLFELTSSSAMAWTDSQIVLHWLPKTPSTLNRFVANRVAAINDLLPEVQWRHVPSAQNPADLASRGTSAAELSDSSLWWHGPEWLRLSQDNWPPPFLSKPSVPIYSVSVKPDLSISPSQSAFIVNLCAIRSSFFSLVRVVCYVLRFIHNCKLAEDQRETSSLSFSEVEKAKYLLYRLSQLQALPECFEAATQKKQLPRGHALHRYHLQISPHQHLQALSRVRNADNLREPMVLTILSTKSELTRLLLSTLHRVYGHPGTATLISILSTSFVVVGLRNHLKLLSRKCVTCQKTLAKPLSHIMGMLPAVRTTPAPPFAHSGVDFAGPLTLRVGHTRRPVYVKSFIIVFVCMCTKAVHLDLCSNLSTEDFMAALRRFVARRGCPDRIFSDNGTNFCGAREEIRAIQELTRSEKFTQKIANFAMEHDLEWSHIPPRAPHFGGLWEAAVKIMKRTLKKIAQPHPLTWPELYSLLTEVESILNSRPICPQHTSDLEEDLVLTPGHFLIGRPLKALPTKLPSTGKISLLKRWNLVERLKAEVWRTWTASYLASCAQRAKWLKPGYTLKVGDIVLIRDETLKSRDWPLAIVEELHSGTDGVTRAATLKCQGKTYKRATNRLVPLVTDEDEDHKT